MGFDQKGSSVFCVVRGDAGQWDVTEEGFDKPLASFDAVADAREYAHDLGKTKKGSTVKFFDEQGKEISAKDSAEMPH